MGLLFFLILFLPVAAITGGIAGAIVGGGREDRPIWQNAVIGIVGWTVAAILVAAATGTAPEELTIGYGFVALLASIAFILVDQWWSRRSPPGAHEPSKTHSSDTLRRLGRTFARLVGLVFALLGMWVLVINLVELSYTGATLAWVLTAGLLGGAGGVFYLLSFDGPDRFRTRGTRMAAWAGMLVLALLPSSLSFILLALVVLASPTLLRSPGEQAGAAPVA